MPCVHRWNFIPSNPLGRKAVCVICGKSLEEVQERHRKQYADRKNLRLDVELQPSEVLSNAAEELAKQSYEKLNEVIRKAFLDAGYLSVLEDELKNLNCRFRKVVVECREGMKHLYVDNGTREGLLVISLEEKVDFQTVIAENGQVKFVATTKYIVW